MEFIQELLSTIFIIIGTVFIIIASVGILKLPDFYIRMSAITKAGTVGVGFIALGIAIYFNDLSISIKSFVINSFMMVTAPVAAHIIARAAYRQGIPFWGKNLVDELNELEAKKDLLEEQVVSNPNSIETKTQLINCYITLPTVQGGSLKKAILIASDIKEIDALQGHAALAMIYERDNDFILAEEEYKQAVKASNDSSIYKYKLANFYGEIGRVTQAIDMLEKILAENSDETDAMLELGKAIAVHGKNLQKGISALNSYIEQANNDNEKLSEAYCSLGKIYLKQNDKQKAKSYFAKAIDINPNSLDIPIKCQ